MANLPYKMKWQEVKNLFRDNVGDVGKVELFKGRDGRPMGSGLINFPSEELAKNAVQKMHHFEHQSKLDILFLSNHNVHKSFCGLCA